MKLQTRIIKSLSSDFFCICRSCDLLNPKVSLAREVFTQELNDTLNSVIQAKNSIKSRPNKATMWNHMDAEYSSKCPLFYIRARWLFLGKKFLLRVYELRNEMYSHLHDANHALASMYVDDHFQLNWPF